MLFSAHCGAEATDQESQQMVERINQRYDNFFERGRQLEEQDARREKAASEIKAVRQEHEQAMEKARADFVKARKVEIPDPRWEREWEQQQQAWREQNKVAGRRFVQQRDYVEGIERKGRMIPQMKEYDLED